MIRTGAWDLGCDTDVFFSAATCEGDDDGQGDACVLNADGSGCAVEGGDCEYTPASGSVGGARAFHAREVRKRYFLSTFNIKIIILPRQARDKHRKLKKAPFSCRAPSH